jgi:uncharacterized protein
MNGSVMLCSGASEEEVLERVKDDIYSKEGVWDLGNMKVMPFRSAVRVGL